VLFIRLKRAGEQGSKIRQRSCSSAQERDTKDSGGPRRGTKRQGRNQGTQELKRDKTGRAERSS